MVRTPHLSAKTPREKGIGIDSAKTAKVFLLQKCLCSKNLSRCPNLRLYWRILCVLRASVVKKRRKPFHHGDTENTEKTVGTVLKTPQELNLRTGSFSLWNNRPTLSSLLQKDQAGKGCQNR